MCLSLLMGSSSSRKRVQDDINIRPSAQHRNEQDTNTTNDKKTHHRSLNSLADRLKTTGETISCTLRRNSKNLQHHDEFLNANPSISSPKVNEDYKLGDSAIGDRLCHYTRDSTIPSCFEQQPRITMSMVDGNHEETLRVESFEDNNGNVESSASSHRRQHLSTSTVISLETGEELGLMTVHELFNCLNDGTMNSYIMDPFYILILDIREREKYDSSHIVTAQPSDVIYTELVLLFNYGYIGGRTSLKDFTMVVICGESSCDLSNPCCRELQLYRELQDIGIQPSLLKGGFKVFHSQYPFLCTNIHITNEQERKQFLQTYPSEIIEGRLYQGRGDQATNMSVVENLKVTHIVNVCTEHHNAFPDKVTYLNINIEDLNSSCLKSYFSKSCEFIRNAVGSDGCVLVHCNLGMSRSSTISLSYLMESRHWHLKEAYDFMKSKRQAVKPNRGFLRQLCDFEKELFGKQLTDPDDIWF